LQHLQQILIIFWYLQSPPSHFVFCDAYIVHHFFFKNGIQLGGSLPTESASLTSAKFGLPGQILTCGIGDILHFCVQHVNNRNSLALIIILEHSFFLLQDGKQEPENVLKFAVAEYTTSQTQAAVEEAVKEVLSQDDGDDEKLCGMVTDIVLQHSMSKVSPEQEKSRRDSELHTTYALNAEDGKIQPRVALDHGKRAWSRIFRKKK